MGGQQKEMWKRCRQKLVPFWRNLSNQVTDKNETNWNLKALRRNTEFECFFFMKHSQPILTLETFCMNIEPLNCGKLIVCKACSLDFVPRPIWTGTISGKTCRYVRESPLLPGIFDSDTNKKWLYNSSNKSSSHFHVLHSINWNAAILEPGHLFDLIYTILVQFQIFVHWNISIRILLNCSHTFFDEVTLL